jgi:hypothetical protein
MDRRKFLTSLVGGVVASAAVRTFPFRVFSFPKEIKLANAADYGGSWEDWATVSIWTSPIGGVVEEISLAEAKIRYGYEWRPGYPRTQQSKRDPRLYCVPMLPSVTGVI